MASAIAIPAQGAVDADVITLATTAKSEITALQAGTSIAGVNGVTMPAGGALTTGAVLRATGVATAAYGAVNLASSDAVTGVLPAANLPYQVSRVTLVAGTVTVAAGIVITAASRVIPVLVTPGAGASGTRYAISGLTVGGAGVGAFTVTAKDSGAGDNLVNTDVSVLDCIIIG